MVCNLIKLHKGAFIFRTGGGPEESWGGVSDGPWDYVTMSTNHFWEEEGVTINLTTS